MSTSTSRGGGAARLHHRIRVCEAGMVTAELAIAMLAVMPLLLSVAGVAGVASVHVRAVESARTTARMLARGENPVMARDRALAGMPDANVEIFLGSQDARVEVAQDVRPLGLLPRITVRATAVTPLEDLGGH